jgi:deoxycytidine triphosphate deaminase
MIYCDREIEKAIEAGRLIVDPAPEPDQFNSTSLNLRVGDDFLRWKHALRARGTAHAIDIDHIDL